MKIIVDRELCEANAIVNSIDQAQILIFRVEEDDTLTILKEEIPTHLERRARDAVRLCPRQALQVID